MKEIIRFAAVLFIVITLMAGAVYALKIKEISFRNELMTGSVDIKIEQYEDTGHGERLIRAGNVMPNQNVSYIPRVTNLRAPGFVRVRIEIIMKNKTTHPITSECIYGRNNKWIQKGEFFYYTELMNNGDVSDIFKGFHIPEEWSDVNASGFDIKLYADVIQNNNFEPDFDSEFPWGDVVIEAAKEEDNCSYSAVRNINRKQELVYTQNKGFGRDTDNLFEEFNSFMAGNLEKDTMTIKNRSESDIKVYFRTRSELTELQKQMNLSIECSGKKIYNGNLAATDLDDYTVLSVVPAGDEISFRYAVSIPEASRNKYSVLDDEVIWEFKIEEESGGAVRTGDGVMIIPLIIAVAISFAIVVFLIRRRRFK